MDEEITIINSNTRNEKIKNFFINNTKKLITGISIIIIGLVGYLFFDEIKERNKIELGNKFNFTIMNYEKSIKKATINELIFLINENDTTYSPLALYFLLDNDLIESNTKANNLFDALIYETNLEEEVKNLIIYKKALFNSNFASENDLLQMLSPIISSESIWSSHALYLLAEFFYSRGETQKAKEFFNQILILPNSNIDIKLKTKKRINRDLGE
jgi:predicted negative regulator of RcsB-dependent stress response